MKTPKGTELELLNIKGKQYLPVSQRVLWFREEKPNWTIETALESTPQGALAKAVIKDDSGRIIATSHKYEDPKGFPDFREKAETSAIGRALALCGYGTQFALELEEGERIVDAPQGGLPRTQGTPQEIGKRNIEKAKTMQQATTKIIGSNV